MLANVYKLAGEPNLNIAEEIIGKKQNIDEANDYVKQIAVINCSKIGKNINDVSIEFYFETPTCNTVKFVKDRVPLISSVTFLQDAPNFMAVFTDVSFDTFKYKKYKNYEKGKKVLVSTLLFNASIFLR